ncbi:hypothetical protein PLANPX_1924 [Lacipirellula parvula]|uniref:Uncharacterized protein n=1 Tax=Lacipirellula parvula TaxID=2650471 RepID=A0A5K7X8V1_9BACT|nr:hypothetical protein PLANPX_1924 [Lacipirellula parvula]
MSTNNRSTTKPHVRQTPRGDESSAVIPLNRTDAESIDGLVDKIIESIPAEMLAVAAKALAERMRERLSVEQIRQRLTDNAAELIAGRLDEFAYEIREELDEELRYLALSLADEDAETAIEDGELDDFIYDLADNTVHEELNY